MHTAGMSSVSRPLYAVIVNWRLEKTFSAEHIMLAEIFVV